MLKTFYKVSTENRKGYASPPLALKHTALYAPINLLVIADANSRITVYPQLFQHPIYCLIAPQPLRPGTV